MDISLTTVPVFVDVLCGGQYQVNGVIDEGGVNGRYLVELYSKPLGRRVRRVVSSTEGVYTIPGLVNRPLDFFIVAFDHGAEPVNAAISDQLILEPMS